MKTNWLFITLHLDKKEVGVDFFFSSLRVQRFLLSVAIQKAFWIATLNKKRWTRNDEKKKSTPTSFLSRCKVMNSQLVFMCFYTGLHKCIRFSNGAPACPCRIFMVRQSINMSCF